VLLLEVRARQFSVKASQTAGRFVLQAKAPADIPMTLWALAFCNFIVLTT
jgi:hypothetical protein